jgi:hypothetical protein
MHWKIVIALALGFALLPSMAKATNTPELTYPTGTRLALEGKIRAVNVGETKFTSKTSTISCKTASLAGKLKKNNGTEVEADIESVTFGGGCGGSSIITTPESNGVPWCLRSTPELGTDEFQVRGGACAKPVQPIRFDTKLTTAIWQECVYERSATISGTYKTSPEDALLVSSEIEYLRVSGPFLCAASTKIDTSITFERDEAGTNPLYVSAGPALTSPLGTLLAVGSKIRGKNVGEVKMTTSLGTVGCSGAELTGTLKKNTGKEVEADIESASFSGTGSGGACTSPLTGDLTWTFKPATNGLPWCLKANPELPVDGFQIRGNSCASASRPIRVIAEFTTFSTDECHYERAAALAGAFTTHPEDARLEFKNATFLETEPKSGVCPDETTLDSSMTLEKDESGTLPVYID